jgi:hypothetical protein
MPPSSPRRFQAHIVASVLGAAALLYSIAPVQAAHFTGVHHVVTTVKGLSVDQYSWYGSDKLLRTVSLKQEGNGNPGHGGYAVQMTYQTNGGTKTVTVNAENSNDGGFGYFVSHERSRTFTDNTVDTIADKIFHTDDSPLGRDFPVVGEMLNTVSANGAAHQFTMTYHHYGTIVGIPKDPDGNDASPTPTNKSAFRLYAMPITITWVFQGGENYPRIDFVVDMSKIVKPDRVNFDVRGPYGVMVFDDGADGVVDTAMWGDRDQFITTTNPATRNSGWNWSQANTGARYSALIAGSYEMGLFEPELFAKSKLADGYADERGNTSTVYNGGNGCEGETQIIPCDWEWPYQSIQYSLPYISESDPDANSQPTSFKKMAWGSSIFYGTGQSLTQVYDSPTTSESFRGWPKSKTIAYSICVVLGLTTATGLTHDVAATRKGCATTLLSG